MQHAHFPLRHSHCLPLTPALIVRTTDLIQMLSLASAPLGFAPVGLAAPGRAAAPAVRMAAIDDLQSLAKEANPIVGYWDPLNLALLNFWDQGDDATVVRPNSGAPVVPAATITPTEAHARAAQGFLRHSEIKHGRIAMFGFIGFMVHANGIHFPWHIPGDEACGKVSAPECVAALHKPESPAHRPLGLPHTPAYTRTHAQAVGLDPRRGQVPDHPHHRHHRGVLGALLHPREAGPGKASTRERAHTP